jgi:hypothetical protein
MQSAGSRCKIDIVYEQNTEIVEQTFYCLLVVIRRLDQFFRRWSLSGGSKFGCVLCAVTVSFPLSVIIKIRSREKIGSDLGARVSFADSSPSRGTLRRLETQNSVIQARNEKVGNAATPKGQYKNNPCSWHHAG